MNSFTNIGLSEIKPLSSNEKAVLSSLIQETVNNLPNPSFLIPFTEKEQEDLFSEQSKDIAYGFFEEGKLVAVTG
ncbi:MAG: hypothetical protein ACRCZZ_02575, partial [Phocaeicola sp.]